MAPGSTPDPESEPGRWLTTSQVATRLNIKRATVYAYVSRGVLRRVRPAGRRDSWFDPAEIEQFLSARSSVRADTTECTQAGDSASV